jgi:hypothetical protein
MFKARYFADSLPLEGGSSTAGGVAGGTVPLFVRISATDWVEGGWDIDPSVLLARQLKEIGVKVVPSALDLPFLPVWRSVS